MIVILAVIAFSMLASLLLLSPHSPFSRAYSFASVQTAGKWAKNDAGHVRQVHEDHAHQLNQVSMCTCIRTNRTKRKNTDHAHQVNRVSYIGFHVFARHAHQDDTDDARGVIFGPIVHIIYTPG